MFAAFILSFRVALVPFAIGDTPGQVDPAEGSSAPAVEQGQTFDQEVRALHLAKSFLHYPPKEPFVGTIEFEIIRTYKPAVGREPVRQRATPHVGSYGELRLDVWLSEESEHPVIRSIAGRKVWTYWGVAIGMIHESAYPNRHPDR